MNYSRGMWWFDPVTNRYEQDLSLFANLGEHSGSLYGGAFDEINEQIVVFLDSGAGNPA